MSGFLYVKRNAKFIVFEYKNVTQSALFLKYKNAPPLRQFQEFNKKSRNEKCRIFVYKNVLQIVFLFPKRHVTQSLMLFGYKCQLQKFHENRVM